jgi:hypothetical protein
MIVYTSVLTEERLTLCGSAECLPCRRGYRMLSSESEASRCHPTLPVLLSNEQILVQKFEQKAFQLPFSDLVSKPRHQVLSRLNA